MSKKYFVFIQPNKRVSSCTSCAFFVHTTDTHTIMRYLPHSEHKIQAYADNSRLHGPKQHKCQNQKSNKQNETYSKPSKCGTELITLIIQGLSDNGVGILPKQTHVLFSIGYNYMK